MGGCLAYFSLPPSTLSPVLPHGKSTGKNERLLEGTAEVLEGDGQQYKLVRTGVGSAVLIKPGAFLDPRGSFVEFFNVDMFREAGLPSHFVQDCYSVSHVNVLRGFHGDYRTTKLIMVIKGEVIAAIVDLNPESPTYFHVYSVVLSAANRRLLLVPPGFGNSFFVTSPEAVYLYKKTTHFVRGGEMTLRWDCPDLVGGLRWPTATPALSQRDSAPPRTRVEFEGAMRARADLENNLFVRPGPGGPSPAAHRAQM